MMDLFCKHESDYITGKMRRRMKFSVGGSDNYHVQSSLQRVIKKNDPAGGGFIFDPKVLKRSGYLGWHF